MTLTDTIDTPRLLIVDDDPAICYTLQHILEYYGYAVHAAGDGVAALALLLSEQFDLVLIEPRLPGRIDGVNLMQLAAVHQPGAALVLLTGALDLALPYHRADIRRYAALDKNASPVVIASRVAISLAQRAEASETPQLAH